MDLGKHVGRTGPSSAVDCQLLGEADGGPADGLPARYARAQARTPSRHTAFGAATRGRGPAIGMREIVRAAAARLYRLGARSTYPGGCGSRLPILMYHRVVARKDPLLNDVPDAATLADQLRALSQAFTVLPLEEAVERLQAGTLPPRAACITFDDGYRDNYELALPLLQQFKLTATFFVSTGFLDGGRMFNDTVLESVRRLGAHQRIDLGEIGLGQRSVSDAASRIALADDIVAAIKYLPLERREEVCASLAGQVDTPLPDDLMMTSDQVRAMARAGMTIGGHTRHHPILARMDRDAAALEIMANRDALTSLLGAAPNCFAYPNGKPNADYTAEHMELVRQAGYRCAVSTAWGVATHEMNRYQLPRFGPPDRHPGVFVARLMRMSFHHRPELVAFPHDEPSSPRPVSAP
ncbi:polysaccharide deacetylase family protein [Caldimonas brevitalea]|uniref:NodB homology domain-containing protein n=1 Tax=Caldimonas brevitalea TaxID=413882 RepID=A0A0G3BKH1_9BURK|nr:polysaccharide deacetylase family protein [Caldimonas brevitalea]AKJ29877.1 hypothetical protein AAW51_3186 [Caldimonas brevitalea]